MLQDQDIYTVINRDPTKKLISNLRILLQGGKMLVSLIIHSLDLYTTAMDYSRKLMGRLR